MVRILEKGKLGSHPDPYGRMWWDRPAPTIKRECAHIGNGRYAHPEENRLLTVREMATIQGFPVDFQFNGAALSNLYRHIGDAVPPLVSFQMACLVRWILGGKKPAVEELILPGTHLRKSDLTSNLFECA
jgi:DNA (cytosine-5)-methyltransferase 1